MFFNIKNAVQGELVDTTEPKVTDGKPATDDQPNCSRREPNLPPADEVRSGVSDANLPPDGGPLRKLSPRAKVTKSVGETTHYLLSKIKEADRERAMCERIDLSTIEEDSEEEEVKDGRCLPATPPEQPGECDPNWGSDSDTVWRAQSQDDDPWYTHGIYVLCKNSKPIQYFNYKCLALRRMRDEARDMCLLDVNYNYRVIHQSDTQIQVVRTHKWWVVAYDDVVADWTIYRVYKKNNR